MKRVQRKNKPVDRLNLTSVLDAIFIFIFFLLLSAQFISIFELESEAPAVTTLTNEKKDEKKPLNLTLEILPTHIIVKTGMEGVVSMTVAKDKEYDLPRLNDFLRELKKNNSTESTVIFKPEATIPYDDIIKIIDMVSEIPRSQGTISILDKNGAPIQTRILFNKVVFDTVI
ncbi:MAG: hypothetical protein A2504_09060 [Bdellovibrionales bacterium RIFOXYD12_FULL_39_22]|nr:MAG: hypothetical protein A2385_17490 [Bdellovibrionales bacterium RIFOXYB1_FULL_39_21]OFZ41110.1 MAG: hypothetical protein A2485_00415 [Bdellovibrionales bacterium RIFOXYC12_FULL_39_17]OFZ50323.1 MAG: hypothetical protein A2404_07730 [Bdellovibrionales bacterium RIFOXYC1_FULL_39_130]OFZ73420.1 MAG: hypothetical protein A2451_07345 [Bdellovibrionales bacterium RIFOXYC2_FULL_39_8]OFZ75124.1 MAG: hypothetical protein A2560_16425 [Bdellovibrionales bacterium RIFOXYD1_FULL_39_84]OFZ92234.1 MAG: